MPVLLMRLAAPMQSWGAGSRFTRRDTEMMPTKSGVIGMLAAAMGMGRDQSLERFSGLRFGVRVDQPGTLMSDFHTAEDLKHKPSTGRGKNMLPLSIRYYLQDAVFLAGLESPDVQELERYRSALRSPYYPIFLGRRSCPPDGPIRTWISPEPLEEALQHAPWCASDWYQRKAVAGSVSFPEQCFAEIMVEPAADGTQRTFTDTIADEPTSFDPRDRRWRPRSVTRLPDVRMADAPDRISSAPLFEDDAIFDTVAAAAEPAEVAGTEEL
ncbi:type I-E CRISPR-associated protein Cas5/CasD [Bifidobacterium samirii]|uniref:CRISPR-associated protein Cas5 family n=1 Tax=Bifidobacterium samirii TaxID=2306974 RepID=A0A430FE69_9BIFI|nr:type I-E CRISPR-associated protein Cas5/CasD [Bifidobacterium samirii]RSX51078.1 CRISPR-associated protein Cas5 family [Bifidobacterium samirii]